MGGAAAARQNLIAEEGVDQDRLNWMREMQQMADDIDVQPGWSLVAFFSRSTASRRAVSFSEESSRVGIISMLRRLSLDDHLSGQVIENHSLNQGYDQLAAAAAKQAGKQAAAKPKMKKIDELDPQYTYLFRVPGQEDEAEATVYQFWYCSCLV